MWTPTFEQPGRLKRIALRLGSATAALGAAVGALAVVFIFNAGITYRIDCVVGTQGNYKVASHWTYEWAAPLPFVLGPHETGCATHGALRILAAKAGVGSVESATIAGVTASIATTDGARYQVLIQRIADGMNSALSKQDGDAFETALREGIPALAGSTVPDYLVALDRRIREDLTATLMTFRDYRNDSTPTNKHRFLTSYNSLYADDNAVIAAINAQ